MAHRVLGIDLGAHSVKVAELLVAMRSMRLVRLETINVVHGPGPALHRSLGALAGLITQDGGVTVDSTDMVSVGMPGDRVFFRAYQIPFTDLKKVQQVVSSELADDLPWEDDDVVFDQRAVAGAKESAVLVAGSTTADVEALLSGLMAHGVEPKSVLPSPLAYGTLLRRVAPEGPVVVLDMGHVRTTVALVKDGRVSGARVIFRGGHQLTESVRDLFQLTYAEAETLKEREGTVVDVPEDGGRHHLSQCLRAGVGPLITDIRHTIQLLATRANTTPEAVWLCGGTSQLEGIDRFVSAALELPTRRISLSGDAELGQAGLNEEGEGLGALALSIALEQGRRSALNLRQGRFAFKRTHSVLRDKLVPFTASIVAIILFFVLSMSVSLHTLGRENAQLHQELARVSQRVLGEKISDPSVALRKLQEGLAGQTGGVPDKSAADVFRLLSSRMPLSTEITLDVKRLDIRPGKLEFAGMVESRSAVGLIVEALKQDECFDEIGTGKISQVADDKKGVFPHGGDDVLLMEMAPWD